MFNALLKEQSLHRKFVSKQIVCWVLILGLVSCNRVGLRQVLQRNLAARDLVVGILSSDPSKLQAAYQTAVHLSSRDCRNYWFAGLAANYLENAPIKDQLYEATLRCSSEYIGLVMSVARERQDLAQLAVDRYPDMPDTWFWLAGTYSQLEGSAQPLPGVNRDMVIECRNAINPKQPALNIPTE